MSHIVSQTGPPFRDALPARLRLAIIVSLLLNIALWSMAASVANHPPAYQPRPVEITRVIINQQGKKIEKVIKKEEIKKKVQQIRKVILRPKPRPEPHPLAHVPPPKPTRAVQKPPRGAHNRVLVAKVDKNAPPPDPTDHTALPDGNAAQGKVIDQQNAGNAAVNPPQPVVKPDPKPDPVPEPVKPKPDLPPVKPPEPVPVPEPVKPKPDPLPEPVKPKPKGPSREAEPTDQVKPEIPDSLKQQGGYKSFVRVKVVVEADGSAMPILRTSSGNPDIDNRVLEALKQWKWKPALKDGVPVQSTQLFKFEFLVE
jgi:TonB family protein